MTHTPTPWIRKGLKIYRQGGNAIISFLQRKPQMEFPYENAEANIERVVACVNACAEFQDPKIDIGLLKLDNEQKAKLLASCETALLERDAEITKLKARVAELEKRFSTYIEADEFIKNQP